VLTKLLMQIHQSFMLINQYYWPCLKRSANIV